MSSLPEVEAVRKRVREEEGNEGPVMKAYQEICQILNKQDALKLAESIVIGDGDVHAFANMSYGEKQRVYAKIANTPGYIVSVNVRENDVTDQDVPGYVWKWPDFWRCVYDGFSNVAIRVE